MVPNKECLALRAYSAIRGAVKNPSRRPEAYQRRRHKASSSSSVSSSWAGGRVEMASCHHPDLSTEASERRPCASMWGAKGEEEEEEADKT